MTSGYIVAFVERKETNVGAADPRTRLWRPHQKAVSQIQWKDGVPTSNPPPVTPPASANDTLSLEHAAPLAGAEMNNVSQANANVETGVPEALLEGYDPLEEGASEAFKTLPSEANTRTTCNRRLR
jgi:hypothetical protein